MEQMQRDYEIECRLNLLEHAARCERDNYIRLEKRIEKLEYERLCLK